VYVSACSNPGSFGKAFGLFWGTIPLVHLYSSMLSLGVFDPTNIEVNIDKGGDEIITT